MAGSISCLQSLAWQQQGAIRPGRAWGLQCCGRYASQWQPLVHPSLHEHSPGHHSALLGVGLAWQCLLPGSSLTMQAL